MTTVAQRLAVKPRLRGIRIRLPAEDDIVAAAGAGLDFALLDLIGGPGDEGPIAAHLRLAHGLGLLVVASVEDPGAVVRLARLGMDAVVMLTPGTSDSAAGIALIDTAELTIVSDPTDHSQTAFTALDLAAVRLAALETFGADTDDKGESEPVLLLAGQLGDVSVWDDVVAALPDDRRYVAHRIDLDESIEEMAESVLAAAPRRFALVGHSLGGIVALQICRAAPGRVTRLALLNSSGRGASPGQLRAWAEQREQIDAGHFDELVATLADINLAPDHPDLARHRQRWDRMARIVGPDGLRRQLAAQAARPDSLPTLQQLAMTALVVSGGADTVCRPALQVELAAGLPNARHVTLDGVGHMAPLEAPVAVAELLTRWLAD